MSEFCSIRDVRIALTPGGSSEGQETAASLEDWQIEDAINEAEGVVRLHVLSRYTIPVSEIVEDLPETPEEGDVETVTVAPYPVRGWTRNIAAYLATLTFRKNKDLTEDDPVRLRYASTLADLVSVLEGRFDLNEEDFPLPDDVGGGTVHVVNQYEGKLFGPEDFGLGYAGQIRGPQVYWPRHG